MTELAKRSFWRGFRPRYGLRTLFVVMTLVACGLGWLCWDLKIIRERRAMEQRIRSSHRGTLFSAENFPYLSPSFPATTPYRLSSVPWHRAWLGDEAIQIVLLGDGRFSAEEIEEIESLFSEANIYSSGKEYKLLRAAH